MVVALMPAEEFEKIREVWPGAQLRSDGGNAAVYLPAFEFSCGGRAVTMDLLLYPHSRGGYVTRCFLGRRWRVTRIGSRISSAEKHGVLHPGTMSIRTSRGSACWPTT